MQAYTGLTHYCGRNSVLRYRGCRNTQARYNVCPTTTIYTVIERKGMRELVPMPSGLVPAFGGTAPQSC